MTDQELKELVKQVKAINNKLEFIINKLDGKKEPNELRDRGIVNGLLHICTQPNYTDKQYTDALKQIGELPFGLSPKQISWCLVYCNRHPNCGEEIQLFIKRQFEKAKDKNEYINQIASVLRSKYSNDNNADYIEKLIQRIQEI